MLVDLFTESRELEDIMLCEFPATIFENQHYVDKSDPDTTLYCFFSLPYNILFRFLKPYRDKYEFEIRDGDGKLIEVNKFIKIEPMLN